MVRLYITRIASQCCAWSCGRRGTLEVNVADSVWLPKRAATRIISGSANGKHLKQRRLDIGPKALPQKWRKSLPVVRNASECVKGIRINEEQSYDTNLETYLSLLFGFHAGLRRKLVGMASRL